MLSIQNVINSDNTVISYSSDGKPFSYFQDDVWRILNEGVKLNFGNLSDGFKSVCKRLIFKLLNGDELINKKSIGMKYIQGFSIFDKCIIECGGTDFYFY